MMPSKLNHSISKLSYSVMIGGMLTCGIVMGLQSCKKEKELINVVSASTLMGTVTGTVYAENGKTRIPLATVFVDDKGKVYLTKSDKEGDFSLLVPIGSHTLNIQSGGGQAFNTQISINVTKGGTTNVPAGSSKLQQVGDLAYITGIFDKIETIIIDSLGYSATEITKSDLSNYNLIKQYKAIFLNCGSSFTSLDSNKYANLNQFVSDGGKLYASDWAIEYLTGDGNNILGNETGGHKQSVGHHSSKIYTVSCAGEIGGFVPDVELCTQQNGASGLVANADIVASDIQSLLGGSKMDIDYDWGSWDVIQVLGPMFNILIEDNSPSAYGPLAVRSVNLTTNNGGNGGNLNKITICHIPPGNPGNPQTITISTNALQAHLDHGDSVGSCENDGNIVYTTFHNHAQGKISTDMQKVLEYFIMNL